MENNCFVPGCGNFNSFWTSNDLLTIRHNRIAKYLPVSNTGVFDVEYVSLKDLPWNQFVISVLLKYPGASSH